MNELQIRLTADIKDLQSALAKAKQTLKSFESETATDSEKSNVGFRRKIGLIEQLTAKAKQLKVSLSQATNEQQIASFNAELEQTNIELARLNALGKSFSAPAVRSFQNLKSSAGAATGSAIAFSRIIQDAPFGIIGVANNLQSFGEQFAALGGKATTAGQRLSMFFSALITPANLAILAVSALTAAWQAYSLGLFDSEEETKDLRSETEKLNDSLNSIEKNLDAVNSARLDGNKSAADEITKLELLNKVLTDVNKPYSERVKAFQLIKEGYGSQLGNMTQEKALAEGIGDAYLRIVSSINQRAAAEAIFDKIVELKKQELALLEKEKIEVSLQNQALKERERISGEIAKRGVEINKNGKTLAEIFGDQTVDFALVDLGNSLIAVNDEFFTLGNNVAPATQKALEDNADTVKTLIGDFGGLTNAVDIFVQKTKELKDVPARTKEIIPDIPLFRPRIQKLEVELPEIDIKGNQGFIEELQKRIQAITLLRDASRDLGEIDNFNIQLEALQQQLAQLNGDQVSENINLIVDAFSSLGAGIAASLNISDRALRGFVTTLLSATPKIIGAIIAQAAANRAKAKSDNIANAEIATGNVIVSATETAKGLGPVGLAVLPVLIAGAVALISSAFGKAGGGGGSASAGQGSTFTNRREFGGPVSKGRAYIVGEKRPELFVPNTNGIIVPQVPSMDYSGASVSSAMYGVEVMLKGPDDLLFFVEQAQIRRNIR